METRVGWAVSKRRPREDFIRWASLGSSLPVTASSQSSTATSDYTSLPGTLLFPDSSMWLEGRSSFFLSLLFL